jgi:hypothetical protein
MEHWAACPYCCSRLETEGGAPDRDTSPVDTQKRPRDTKIPKLVAAR